MRKVLGSLGTTLAVALVMAASPAGAAGLAPGGMAPDPDGLEGVALPLNGTSSVALGPGSTQDAPEFGFDVSVQAVRPFFPDGIDDAPQFGYDVSVQTAYDQLSGGWHDAGDHVKFNFPIAVSAVPAGAYEDELVWGAIWI
jgi:hypothetical protein